MGACPIGGGARPCCWVIRFFVLLHGSACLQWIVVGAQRGGLGACWSWALLWATPSGTLRGGLARVCCLDPEKLGGLKQMGKRARTSL